MSAGTNAFGARAGFNQSGGGHFMTLAPLCVTNSNTASVFANVILSNSSNSGGAFSNATFVQASSATIFGATTAAAGTLSFNVMNSSNLLLKDMGRTVVSSGRTFRKFAPVVSGNMASTFGVAGSAGVAPNLGYATFYVEVGREGATPSANVAPIVRYF